MEHPTFSINTHTHTQTLIVAYKKLIAQICWDSAIMDTGDSVLFDKIRVSDIHLQRSTSQEDCSV